MKEYKITIDNNTHNIIIKSFQADTAIVEVNGKQYNIRLETKVRRHLEPLEVKPTLDSVQQAVPAGKSTTGALQNSDKQILAPLPGMIQQIFVKEGDKVSRNQVIMKMEAMKMENDIKSDVDGIIEKIHVSTGEAVLENTLLISLGKY